MAQVKDLAVFCTIFALVPGFLAMRVNITTVVKCPFIEKDLTIDLIKVTYFKDGDGFVETLGAKYIVRNEEPNKKDLKTEVFMCKEKPEGPCTDNKVVDDHHFNCEEDVSVIGPWTIKDTEMTGKRCNHEEIGIHEMDGIMLNMEYFEKYMSPEYTHYRMSTMFHKTDDTSVDGVISCVSVELDEVK